MRSFMSDLVRFGFFGLVCMGPLSAQDAPPIDKAEDAPPQEPRGLRVKDARALDGYTLITPLKSVRALLLDMDGKIVHTWQTQLAPGNSVYLLDNGNLLRCVRIVDGGIFEGGGIGGRVQELAPDGSVVWDYTLAEEFRHHHHDIEPMPNGNILLIVWERISHDKALSLGRDPKLMESGELWPDMIVEVKKTGPTSGAIVWEWHTKDHLIQDFDRDKPNYGEIAANPGRLDINADRRTAEPPHGPPPGGPGRGPPGGPGGGPGPRPDGAADDDRMRQLGYVGGQAKGKDGKTRNVKGADWMHVNGIDYDAALDQIVFSSPKMSEFYVIDHSTTTDEAKGSTGGKRGKGGDFLYRWGNPAIYASGGSVEQRLFHQHDAQWIESGLNGAGHFLVFNNGPGRADPPFSSVDEIVPPLRADGTYALDPSGRFGPDQPTWSYGRKESERFFSSFISGAQRLKNGNTLICSGENGRIFEVTADGEIVWEYWNEHGGDSPKEPGPTGMVQPFALFRATRIAKDHPGVKIVLGQGGAKRDG